ncbi:MAG TPA: hypothetical protein DCE42_21620 [Myxococcales bacterium]|nr:hypothetical protein [Myxococcales bacterium]
MKHKKGGGYMEHRTPEKQSVSAHHDVPIESDIQDRSPVRQADKIDSPSSREALQANRCPVCDSLLIGDDFVCESCGASLLVPLLDHVIFEEWRLVQKIGEGGMGFVYKAIHVEDGREAAIKIMKTGEADPILIERFLAEATFLQTLKHPNIVETYSFGYDEDIGFYIVMEYLEGIDLDAFVMKDRLLPIPMLLKIFMQVCDAVSCAHQKNIVHRDLKPGNVFLVGELPEVEKVKLLDFGVARALDSHVRLTEDGFVMGTPNYLSPEQALGRPLEPQADIYSLAAIMYELLTGSEVFEFTDHYDLMQKKITRPPRSLADAHPDRDYPQGLEELIAEGLRPDPDERIQGAMAFKRRIKEILDGIDKPHDDQREEIVSVETFIADFEARSADVPTSASVAVEQERPGTISFELADVPEWEVEHAPSYDELPAKSDSVETQAIGTFGSSAYIDEVPLQDHNSEEYVEVASSGGSIVLPVVALVIVSMLLLAFFYWN